MHVQCPDTAHVASRPLTCPFVLQYEADSAPALALNASIERTEKRFATYAKQGLLCGTDGLPHLISDPGLAIRYGHTGETLVSDVLLVLRLQIRDQIPANAELIIVLHTLQCYAAALDSTRKSSTLSVLRLDCMKYCTLLQHRRSSQLHKRVLCLHQENGCIKLRDLQCQDAALMTGVLQLLPLVCICG